MQAAEGTDTVILRSGATKDLTGMQAAEGTDTVILRSGATKDLI